MRLNLIVAFDQNYNIGYKNSIPWHFPEDLKHFKKITTNNICIMGKNTWDSLPLKPLLNRTNIVISSTYFNNKKLKNIPNVLVFNEFGNCLNFCLNYFEKKEIFVIGGRDLYQEVLNYYTLKRMIVTHIKHEYEGDVKFPHVNWNAWKVNKVLNTNKDFDIIEYVRK